MSGLARSLGTSGYTSLPARTSGLARNPGATPFTSFQSLGSPISRTPMSRSGGRTPRPNPGRARNQARDTGFSQAVKLAIRARAGDGDPDQALAECCGIWLGRYGGDIQHIIARGAGGSSRPSVNFVINGALMCRPHHELAESRDPGMYERGFWRHSWEVAGACPLMLHGGFTRWLLADGTYGTEAPGGDAA